MIVKIYRDCDARLRVRKIVIELRDDVGDLVDRTRMFAGAFLAGRLKRRVSRMTARAAVFAAAE